MAGGAAAAAIVAGLIVRTGEREQRIEQARLLQPEEHGIHAELSPEAAIAQLDLGPPRIILAHRIAWLALFAAAALEHAQHVTRLRDFPPLERVEVWKDACARGFFCGGRRPGQQPLRRAVAAVTFPEARVLVRIRAVVVERRLPEHGAVRHHARSDALHFGGMAAAARAIRHAEIAGIDELNVLG